jgi:hypothetical protein
VEGATPPRYLCNRNIFNGEKKMSDQQEMSKEPPIGENPGDTQDLKARGRSRRGVFKRVTAALALLIGIACVGGLIFQIRAHAPRPESVARVGKALPTIPVTDESGRVWDVAKAGLGAKTVIVFYSTSCEVCQQELPNLRPFPSTLGLIMVNEGDGSSEEIDKLRLPYTKQFYDRDHVFERLSHHPGLPTILLVDEQAVLRGALVGAHSPEVLRGELAEFAAADSRTN